MPKQERWKHAWDFFVGEFTGEGPKYHGGRGFNSKIYRNRRKELDKFYWTLIGVLEEFGIQAWKHKDLGTSRDARGNEFAVGGTWDARGRRVNLLSHSPHVLAHEFTHAMDYANHGWRPRAGSELVANAGGYLLECHYGGIHSPFYDIGYAKRQGATTQTLARLQDYIPDLFLEMVAIIDSTKAHT